MAHSGRARGGTFPEVAAERLAPGDRVEYIGAPVFDGIIDTGEIGWVTKVEGDWVYASWPRSGVHSVPLSNVRLLGPEVTRAVAQRPAAGSDPRACYGSYGSADSIAWASPVAVRMAATSGANASLGQSAASVGESEPSRGADATALPLVIVRGRFKLRWTGSEAEESPT